MVPELEERWGDPGVPGKFRFPLALTPVSAALGLVTALPRRQRSHRAAAGKQNRLCQVPLWEIKREGEFRRGPQRRGGYGPLSSLR